MASKTLLEKLSRIDDLRKLKDFDSRGDQNGLVMKVQKYRKTPDVLFKKHVLNEKDNCDEKSAAKLSKRRNETFKNTVFEHTESLHLCQSRDRSSGVLISMKPLHAYDCTKMKNGKWKVKHLGEKWALFETRAKNYHFTSSSLSINNIMFQ